jgi:hypothetical protein
MNIEQTCADAIAVVERYLANTSARAFSPRYRVYMMNEVCAAKDAVGDAWDSLLAVEYAGGGSIPKAANRLCCAAWWACAHTKDDECNLAKMYVDEYKELVK